MSAWITSVPIFDGEDEEELKAQFVKFSALYPNYSPFEVGEHVFRNLPDPISRGQQAGAVWGKDLEIRERVRLYHSGESDKSDTRTENLIKEAWLIATDFATDPRDRVKALELIARMQGDLKKDKEADDGKKQIDRPYSFHFIQKDFDKPPPSEDAAE